MIRKSLFLILALALLSVPVFLMAHAFTHFAQVDVLDVAETGNSEEADLDDICFDCLALTALNILAMASGFLLGNPATCLHLLSRVIWRHSSNQSFSYHSRAPPVFL